MRIRRNQAYAVVTGDVVGSTKMSSGQRALLRHVLRRASRQLQEHFKDSVPPGVDVFRGDSWQFVVSKPAKSLRAALFFRAFFMSQMKLRTVDTRLAIGIGPIDFLPPTAISSGDGEAFRRSGLALDKMPRTKRMAIDGPSSIGSLGLTTVNVLIRLIDTLARGWTDRQAYAVCGALLGWKQEKIASVWFKGTVSQQAVAQHLERAGWNAVGAALKHIEENWAATRPETARKASASGG